ncbi:MAG: response regulator [Oscillospiraceae bacterium]|jgi:putative two-component system response regulator|nr:response regulator [Oscillospiraceae bacterium]
MSVKKIIVVDDTPFNLNMCKSALKDLYDIYLVRSAEGMFDVLERFIPDLILLDVDMPGIHGYDAMKMLQSNESFKEIPVIFLSAMDDEQNEMKGLDLGAVDYIHKPFVRSLLIKRINIHIRLIEEKKELSAYKESVEHLTSKAGELRASLNTIIEMIESSMLSNNLSEIKHCLGRAKTESALVAQAFDDYLSKQA